MNEVMPRFNLSDRQAEDILEIRLRQLARLEGIKIEQELSELRIEQGKLEEIINNPAALRRLMIKEIEAGENPVFLLSIEEFTGKKGQA